MNDSFQLTKLTKICQSSTLMESKLENDAN